jgi:hypothetical protein
LREEENAEKIRGFVDLTEKQPMIRDACPDPEQCENRGDEPAGCSSTGRNRITIANIPTK